MIGFYIFEYALMALTASVIYLFVVYDKLNIYVRETNSKVIIESTQVMREVKEFMQKFNDNSIENETFLITPKNKKQWTK